jgi:Staphylococcal nuclease homologue
VEPSTDRVDLYERLLRYIIRAKDELNVNVQLVRVGAAAPYFFESRRGRYAALLERLAPRAKAKKLGLRGRCPHAVDEPRAEDRGPDRPACLRRRGGGASLVAPLRSRRLHEGDCVAAFLLLGEEAVGRGLLLDRPFRLREPGVVRVGHEPARIPEVFEG